MREAHPESGAAARQTFLNTSNRLWRKKVMPLLGFNPAKHVSLKYNTNKNFHLDIWICLKKFDIAISIV